MQSHLLASDGAEHLASLRREREILMPTTAPYGGPVAIHPAD